MISLGISIAALGVGSAAAALGMVDDRIASIGKTIESLKLQQQTALTNMSRAAAWSASETRLYANEVERLDKRIQTLGGRKEFLEQLGSKHAQNMENLSKWYEKAKESADYLRKIVDPGMKAAKFEDRVKQISIGADVKGGQEGAMAQAVRQASVKYAVANDEVLDGIEKLRAQGMQFSEAQGYAGLIAQARTATRMDMGDLAKLISTLQTQFGVTGEAEMKEALSTVIKAGKLGQYDLKQFSKGLPDLGAGAASLGVKGIAGVGQLGAIMQVMQAGTGSAEAANSAMQHWFSSIGSEKTQAGFQKVGINFERDKLKLMADQRVSAVQASFMVFDNYLDRITQNGAVDIKDKQGKVTERVNVRDALSKILEKSKAEGADDKTVQERLKEAVERMGLSGKLDPQSIQAYVAYQQGKGKYQNDLSQLNSAEAKQTLNSDFAQQMQLTTKQVDYMHRALDDLVLELGGQLSPIIGMVAKGIGWLAEKATWLMQTFPGVTKAVVYVVGGLALGVQGFLAAGTAIAGFRAASTVLQMVPGIGGAMRVLGSVASTLGGVLRGALSIGLRIAGQAILFIGRALLMNPIGLAVTVIAGAAYLIYRNWGAISSWFGGVWNRVKVVFGNAVGWFKALPAQFARMGRDLINGLVGGFVSRLSAVKEAVVGLGQSIKGWFADKLGIKSPSRVFMGFGSNIGEGAQLGIVKSVPSVKSAVGKLAGIALAGAVTTSGNAFAGVKQAGQTLSSSSATAANRTGPMGGGGVSVNFAPTIHLGGAGGGGVRGQLNEAMKLSMQDLERMLRRLQSEQQRRAF